MRIRELKERWASTVSYVEKVIALKKDRFVPKPKTTEQAPSTKWALENDPSVPFVAPIDPIVPMDKWKWWKGDPGQIALLEQHRRSGAKNTIGQSEFSSASSESKAKALKAFLDIKGITLTEDEKFLVHKYYTNEEDKDVKEKFVDMLKAKAVTYE